jgi:osmoprotectant transport system permease protein
VPALAALFLYGLLPIIRNTHAGLVSIPAELREAAVAIGLSPLERLRHVELPLASRTILAGIKTSAVVAVGSATIAAFIGAGGFGVPISTGLSLNDVSTILEGAIPAAGLALLVEGLFAGIERVVVPRALREAR